MTDYTKIDPDQDGPGDWEEMFPALVSLHGGSARSSLSKGLPWEDILAGVQDPAERPHLERLAGLCRQHPEVVLRLAAPGLVEMVAPPAWVAAHPYEYAEAVMTLHQAGAAAVRQYLLPKLEGR